MVDFIGKDRESGISKGNDSYINSFVFLVNYWILPFYLDIVTKY